MVHYYTSFRDGMEHQVGWFRSRSAASFLLPGCLSYVFYYAGSNDLQPIHLLCFARVQKKRREEVWLIIHILCNVFSSSSHLYCRYDERAPPADAKGKYRNINGHRRHLFAALKIREEKTPKVREGGGRGGGGGEDTSREKPELINPFFSPEIVHSLSCYFLVFFLRCFCLKLAN